MSLPVIRIQKKTVYQRRLYSKNRKGPLIGPTGLSSNTTEIVILLQTTTLATTYIRAPDNPPAAASVKKDGRYRGRYNITSHPSVGSRRRAAIVVLQ